VKSGLGELFLQCVSYSSMIHVLTPLCRISYYSNLIFSLFKELVSDNQFKYLNKINELIIELGKLINLLLISIS